MQPVDFAALHRPGLEANRARHGLILSIFDNPDGCDCWSLGEPAKCAVMTPGRAIVLGDLNPYQCHWLADLTMGVNYPGVIGPDQTVEWFLEEAQALGLCFWKVEDQLIWSIARAPLHPDVAGRSRPLTNFDTNLLDVWWPAFQVEANPDDALPTRQMIRHAARDEDFTLWEVDGEPVAMAGITRRIPMSAAITAVYVPPRYRGKGYGGAVTAATVERIRAEGRDLVSLYTNLNDPAANRCYEKIGFEKVCGSMYYRRS